MSDPTSHDPFEQDFRELLNASTSEQLGQIGIAPKVAATIVKLAALEVPGVVAVGGTYVEKLAGFFKEEEVVGIRVGKDDAGRYTVEVRVALEYGLDLAQVALDVQANVKDKVEKMTSNTVATVNVWVDEVRLRPSGAPKAVAPGEPARERDPWASSHTD